MKQKNIAIQGIEGSFHHMVTQAFFEEEVAITPCMAFPELIDQLLDENCTDGIMAIENSIAGAILPNYALIDGSDIHITGEYYLPINHNLLGLPGQEIKDIKEVHSHPMALLQCRTFFRAYPHIKLVQDTDTSAVARRIREQQLKGIGAIASQMAAKLFAMNIIAPDIQTIQNNATRFFILNKEANYPAIIDKASIRFTTDHKRGSLATILNVLSDCELNLTKIQSMPIIETPWKYAFFVDVTFDTYAQFDKAKNVLQLMTTDFKVLGEYKNATS